ncbi:MAG: TonB-dependent receptor [Candidatus Obscuribacterales bacterium]|nr:TonB-dependent receptor [Steroidobacteraceae bacterium]
MLTRRLKLLVVGTGVAYAASIATLSGAIAAERSEKELSAVTVTATRIEAVSYDVPASITSVSGDSLREAALGVNLADDIAEVPGLLARNRNNYAQDQQISIRGFGASSAFGIRGVRIYQDGMPATGPDGQGQVSQFNLDSAARVEILRGPFSALYGNSSGGVIQIFTADGQDPAQLRGGVAYGSFGTLRAGVNGSGAMGPVGYNAAFTHFKFDGYRDHSSARSESFNSKFTYAINDANRLSLLINVISRPDTEDPLGISEARFREDPDQTDPAALTFNTRKSLEQQQVGLIHDLTLSDAQSLRFLGYYGQRSVEQFLSITTGAQTPATSSGGVVDLERRYGGGDVRWSWQGSLANKPVSLVVGASYDKQNEQRRGYNNFVGTTLGVQGTLRRDEDNIVYDFDEYVQGTWDFAEQWSLMLGARHSDVQFESNDAYFAGTNGDDSGEASYRATSPVAGLMYKTFSWLHLYVSYGQGFQTPIGSELAYRSDGGAGLNLGLRPARSSNAELGAKLRVGENLEVNAAVFQARTNNDIVLNTNSGGRSTYQNARTRRQGAELAVDYRLVESLRLQLAYTYIDATYAADFLTCAATPCPTPTVPIAAGNNLPGVPANNIYAAVRWGQDAGWNASLNVQGMSSVPVNDLNSVSAPGYATIGASGGYVVDWSTVRLSAFVRLNNLLDKRYVGSVIVGDGNQRFFEPAPGRNVLAGINVTWK